MDNNIQGGDPFQGRQKRAFPQKETGDIFSLSFNDKISTMSPTVGGSKKNAVSFDDMTVNGKSAAVRRRDPITISQTRAYVRKTADSPFGCYDLATPRIARRARENFKITEETVAGEQLNSTSNVHERSTTMPSPILFPQTGSPSLINNKEARKLRHVKSLEATSTTPDTFPSPRTSRRRNILVQKVANMFSSNKSHSCPSLSDDEEVNSSTSTLNDVSFSSNFEEMTTPSSSVAVGVGPPASPGISKKKLNTKKWRPGKVNSKAQSNSGMMTWNCSSDNVWINSDGQSVRLDSTSLVNLSHLEWQILRKIAQLKLNQFSLGSVSVPKEPSLKNKKGILGKTRSSNFLYNLKDNLIVNKEAKDSNVGMVFGIPLTKCIYNDSQLNQSRKCVRRGRRESLDLAANPVLRKKPANSINDRKVQALIGLDLGGRHNCDGPPPNLIDALSLSTSTTDKHREEKVKALSPHQPQIPNIVTSCFKHLEKYGMQVMGIFRVGGSKKRIRQLHKDFDNGEEVYMNESYTPHDIAALLKEYFRDLPEPLMTRELYSAFLSAACVEDRGKRVLLLQQLTALLPVANRDTLYALLQFLNKVSSCAEQAVDEQGQELPGNKMDSNNLATLFGPNILHKSKTHKEDFHVVKAERAEENKEVIEVIKFMIDNYEEIFEISPATHCEILKSLQDTDSESSEHILNKKLSKGKSESSEEADDSDHSPTSPQRSAINRLNALLTSSPNKAHWPGQLQMLTEDSSNSSSSSDSSDTEREEKMSTSNGTKAGRNLKEVQGNQRGSPHSSPGHSIPPYKSEMTVSYARQQQERWMRERVPNMASRPAASKPLEVQPGISPLFTPSTSINHHSNQTVVASVSTNSTGGKDQQVGLSGANRKSNTSNNNLQHSSGLDNNVGLNKPIINSRQREQQWLLWELLTSEDGKETLV